MNNGNSKVISMPEPKVWIFADTDNCQPLDESVEALPELIQMAKDEDSTYGHEWVMVIARSHSEAVAIGQKYAEDTAKQLRPYLVFPEVVVR